jgi:hypothetical protein
MAAYRIQAESTAVVLAGSFNPRIFEPAWFSSEGLVPVEEANAAEVQLIDRDFCHLNFGWISLVVTEDRFQAESTPGTVNDNQIRDLLIGVFRLLPHTPVKQGSIHHRWQIELDGEEAWHAVGHALAPKEPWNGILEEPGLFDFAMQGVRPDDLEGAVKIRVQPSRAVENGIFLNVNDEFVPPDPSDQDRPMADIIEGLWPEADKRAMQIRDELLDRLIPNGSP